MPRTHPPCSPEFRRHSLTWSALAVTRLTRRASSNPLPRRSETGSFRPAGRKAAGRRRAMVRARPSVRSWPGHAMRTSSCAWSATSSLERRPGSRARPAPCRRGPRVHEREPGHVPGRRHGPCSRRVGGWPLRLAQPPPVCPRPGGRGAAEAGADRPRQLARNLWGAARARRVASRRGEAWAQACRTPGARRRAGGREPPPGCGHDHAARPGSPPRAGLGGPQVHRDRAEPALGGRCDARPDNGRVAPPGRRARCAEPQARRGASVWDCRSVHGEPPAGRAGGRCVGEGSRPASAAQRGPSWRPRKPAHVPGVRPSGARRQACGRPWDRSATPATTPWARASLPPANASRSNGAASPRRPRLAWPALASSRAGATRSAFTPAWAVVRPSPMKQRWR